MKFGAVPLARAEGGILAHAHHLPGAVLRKGVTLGRRELDALRAAGIEEVVVARLEADDVGENDAAQAVAAAAAGPSITVGRAATGRCNLTASVDGLVRLDTARVDAVNAVHEGMTLACLAPCQRVVRGELVGTVKVIPFAVPRAVVQECSAIAAQRPLLAVAPFQHRRCALILTRLPGTADEALGRATEALAARLTARGSTLDSVRTVAHRSDDVRRAVEDALAEGWSPVFLLGASAIVDRADVIPAAVEAAGGTIARFGIPVDPGNLLLLARHGDIPIVGMPGCARSPRESGFDRVLDMLLADVPLDSAALAGWGIGGLMKEILSRRQPREGLARRPTERRVGTVVLAAGASRRMQGGNKLLEEVDGVPMVARVVETAQAAGTVPVVVVTGHDHAAVEAALAGRSVRWATNPSWAEGMGTSKGARGAGAGVRLVRAQK
jgi:molybdenum cofactor cytidylyltransferase